MKTLKTDTAKTCSVSLLTAERKLWARCGYKKLGRTIGRTLLLGVLLIGGTSYAAGGGNTYCAGSNRLMCSCSDLGAGAPRTAGEWVADDYTCSSKCGLSAFGVGGYKFFTRICSPEECAQPCGAWTGQDPLSYT